MIGIESWLDSTVSTPTELCIQCRETWFLPVWWWRLLCHQECHHHVQGKRLGSWQLRVFMVLDQFIWFQKKTLWSYYPHNVANNIDISHRPWTVFIAPLRSITLGWIFNYPDWDWDTNSIKPSSSYMSHHKRLIEIIEDHSLHLHITTPTRKDNILDLPLTNWHLRCVVPVYLQCIWPQCSLASTRSETHRDYENT